MRPDEGRRPIISQSAPIASGPEHFQAKWNTWRLGKCDHTNSSQVEHLAARKMRPQKDLFWRQPHGAHHQTPFRHIRFHHRAHTAGVLLPHLGISGSAGITRSMGHSKRSRLADGIRHIVNQQINAPGDDLRAGYGATAEAILPSARGDSCALIWRNYRHVRAHGSGVLFGPVQRHSGNPIAQPLVKAYRRPVTEFRRPCLKRAKRRIDLERWQ